jgi:hypothetical protein
MIPKARPRSALQCEVSVLYAILASSRQNVSDHKPFRANFSISSQHCRALRPQMNCDFRTVRWSLWLHDLEELRVFPGLKLGFDDCAAATHDKVKWTIIKGPTFEIQCVRSNIERREEKIDWENTTISSILRWARRGKVIQSWFSR